MIKYIKIFLLAMLLSKSGFSYARNNYEEEPRGYIDQQSSGSLDNRGGFSSGSSFSANEYNQQQVIPDVPRQDKKPQRPAFKGGSNPTFITPPPAPPKPQPTVNIVSTTNNEALKKYKSKKNLKNLEEDKTKREELVSNLIKNNYNIHTPPKLLYESSSRDNSHIPPIYFKSYYLSLAFKASRTNNINDLRSILSKFNLLNGQNKDGDTILISAIQNNSLSSARLLLAKGAYVNATNKRKRTALHYAATTGSIESIKLLLSMGADLSLKDDQNMTAIDYATLNNEVDAVVLINQYIE